MPLLLTHSDVRDLVTMADAIKLVKTGFDELVSRRGSLPHRMLYGIQGTNSRIDLVPGRLDALNALGVKLQVVRHRLPRDHKVHRSLGVISLIDLASGSLQALVDSEAVSTLRNAATSAVATGLLARRSAGKLGVLGAGRQAFAQIEGVVEVRKLEQVLVSSLDSAEHMEPFLKRIQEMVDGEVSWVQDDSLAVRSSDIVVLATTATSPVIQADWLQPGTHVNAVGSDRPTTRELDGPTLLKADKVVCDYTPAVVRECGDLAIPIQSGEYSESRIYADLGEIIVGSRPGRENAGEITVFKSVGLGMLEVGLAYYAYDQAQQVGRGSEFDFEK